MAVRGLRTSTLCALGMAALLAACGDDDGGGDNTAGMGAAGVGAAGMGAAGTGTAGTGTAGTGAAGMGAAGMGGVPMLTCDSNVPTTATCGGTMCPAVTGIAAMTCTVPCCVGDVCGTANSSTQMPRACSVPPEPDPSCPSVDFMGLLELPGCCTDAGLCGVISSISNSCITESAIIDLPDMPQPCGADDGGTDDGG